MATAIARWEEFDGYAVAHNMPDIRMLPLERFCSFIYWMLTRDADESSRAKLNAQLWMPPPEFEPEAVVDAVADSRSPWNPENEGKALSAFKAQFGAATAE